MALKVKRKKPKNRCTMMVFIGSSCRNNSRFQLSWKIFFHCLFLVSIFQSSLLLTRFSFENHRHETSHRLSILPVTDNNNEQQQQQHHHHHDHRDNRPKLRFNWTQLEPLSPLARRIAQHQQNCDLPTAHFWYRNRFGLGSDLHVWSQAVCNAMQLNRRIYTHLPWVWRDESVCQSSDGGLSAMTCYFAHSEAQCPDDDDDDDVHNKNNENNLNSLHRHQSQFNISRGRGRVKNDCDGILAEYNATIPDLRAAATEFLFTTALSERIQTEAERQLQIVFKSNNGTTPKNLITVHIRGGDKADEMELVKASEYVQAVKQIQQQQRRRRTLHVSAAAAAAAEELPAANVFLATEDPRAVFEFVTAAPKEWSIYVDAYFQEMFPHRLGDVYNGSPLLAQTLKGRPGLVALGSLLVAMEANDFVLTTASNWSRLLNELRRNVLDPRCDHCTNVIDLKRGEW